MYIGKENNVEKTVLFLAHGGKSVGMGHVIRCCSLATAFRLAGWKVFFYSKLEIGQQYIKEQSFFAFPAVAQKESCAEEFSYGTEEELRKDCEVIKKLCIQIHPDVIIADSYNVTDWYFKELRKQTKCLVYIDDVMAFPYDVDVVINQNIFAKRKDYTALHSKQLFLLGTAYSLIRDEFCHLPKRTIHEEIRNIMITTGAADPHNVTLDILQLCSRLEGKISFHVVVGNAFSHREDLVEYAEKHKEVVLYEQPSKMSAIMLKCDVAISAGGSTLYELAACGTPAMAFLYAENQRPIVEELERQGNVLNLGFYDNMAENFMKKWEEMKAYSRRKEMSCQMQELIDGKGKLRIIEEMEAFFYDETYCQGGDI